MSSSLSDLEASISSLGSQIKQLEEQRKQLSFSSPAEELDADRRLADLKLRYADTLLAYRKLQTSSRESYSSASSPVQTSSRPKSKVLPIVGIVLLLLVILWNGVSHNSSQGERLKKEEVIRHCVDIAEKRLPGAVSYEWDRVKDTFTLFVWDDSFVSTGLAVKAGKDGSAELWDDLITSLKTVCASMQIKFHDNGYGTTVAVCAVDPSNHDNVLLMVSKNKVLYDATWS